MYFDNQAFLTQLRENRYWYLFFGACLVALGSLAIVFSYTATLFSIIWLAGFLIAVGIIELIQAFKMQFWKKFLLHLLLAALYLLVGGSMLWNPMLNAVTLTLVLAFFFAISGLARIIFALSYDPPHRGWIIFNGATTLLLGFLIWYQWPASGLWTIGLFVGIDTIISGWTWITLSLMLKNPKKHSTYNNDKDT